MTRSRNPHFDLLAGRLQRVGVDQEPLFDALFLMRAPWSLQALVPCCRHLVELCQKVPALTAEPAFTDQAARLAVLAEIAQLPSLPVSFYRAHGHRTSRSGTGLGHPIYGYSGDSGLAELALMLPTRGEVEATTPTLPLQGLAPPEPHVRNAHYLAFRFLCAWFAFQVFHCQAQRVAVDHYRQYLLGDGTPRLKEGQGGRLYAASRVIRYLGDPSQRGTAILAARLIGTVSEARSRELAQLLAETAAGRPFVPSDVPEERDPLLAPLAHTPLAPLMEKEWNQDVGRQRRLASLARWLRFVWQGERVRRRTGGGGHRTVRRGRTTIDLYPDALAQWEPADLDWAGTGWRLDLYPAPEEVANGEDAAAASTAVDPHDYDDDPEEETAVESAVSIYFADGDPQKAFYASRAAAQRMERSNAFLPWPVWRVSGRVLRRVLAQVGEAGHEVLEVLDARAWLALGLSILAGRPLQDAAGCRITAGAGTGSRLAQRMTLDRVAHVLSVPAARPHLQQFRWQPDPFPVYCTHWAATLRLPLPTAWRSLVAQAAAPGKPSRRAIVRRAEALLRLRFADDHVTPKGLVGALQLALQAAGRDDLALTKVLTDFEIANARNLIHYASYPRGGVEARWRRIVEGWLGAPLPAVSLPLDFPDERVGSPFGIDIAKVAAKVAMVQTRFAQSLAARDWAALYNQLTAYTVMWLGLATAGRRVCQPVPNVILADGWALVRDKRRPDESTDRYVPLTQALREQLVALRAFTQALSLMDPELELPAPGAAHALTLRLFQRRIRTGKPTKLIVREFQPKFLDQTAVLRDLPGNWGRKLVRSTASELSGWFKDAGLGHWTVGRHPWNTGSAFPARRFRAQWLALQERLEHELGFTVLAVPALGTAVPQVPVPLPRSEQTVPPRPIKSRSDAELEALLQAGPNAASYAAVRAADPPDRKAIKELLAQVLAQHANRPRPQVRQLATDVCRYLRMHVGAQVFVPELGARFTRNWLVSRQEFQALAYVEQTLLPAITADLAHLPPRDASPRGQRIDLGRLLVALAWRGGVLDTRHLDAVMAALTPDGPAPVVSEESAGDRGGLPSPEVAGAAAEGPKLWIRGARHAVPVLAVGGLRLLELRRVATRRSRTTIARTLLLEPYLAALVSVERVALADALTDAFGRPGAQRAAHWNRALREYLRFLGVPKVISLSLFVGALRQRVLLETSPVVAAYASGETWTYDLPGEEFCRLAGYEPPVEPSRDVDPSAAVDVGARDAGLPADMADAFTEFGRSLAAFPGHIIEAWEDRIAKARVQATEVEERLFCGFAAHLLGYYGEGRRRGPLQERQLATLRAELRIVWQGLVQAHLMGVDWGTVTEAGLEALAEWTEDLDSVRRHHGAWNAFRRYLVDAKVDHAGVTVRGVEAASPRAVNARILSAHELDRIATLLASVRSGIPTQEYREVGARHFALTRNFGTRRAEATGLRWVDVEDELVRVEPYAGHTLKTENAERVLPTAYLPANVWDRLTTTRMPGMERLIDARPGRPAEGDNFYHAVSRVMQHVTGDINLSHHAIRHTVVSALALKVLANGVDLDLVAGDLPWVAPLLPDDRQLAELLGPAGQCGQGLKAVAVALGHLHETTTLRHYVHTLCIALYAYTLTLPRLPLHLAFAQRAASRASLARVVKQARAEGCAAPAEDRRVRDYIERALVRDVEQAAGEGTGDRVLLHATVPLAEIAWIALAPEQAEAVEGWLRRTEAWHNYLAQDDDDPPAHVVTIRAALVEIARIPSGKRGVSTPRHVLPEQATDGTPLPAMIHGSAALERSILLLSWLLPLRTARAELYAWLLSKWRNTSAADDGSMRLDGEVDVTRARQLAGATPAGLEVRVEAMRISRARTRKDRKPSRVHYRMRVRFTGNVAQEPADAAKGLGQIRWVLTWLLVEQAVASATGGDQGKLP